MCTLRQNMLHFHFGVDCMSSTSAMWQRWWSSLQNHKHYQLYSHKYAGTIEKRLSNSVFNTNGFNYITLRSNHATQCAVQNERHQYTLRWSRIYRYVDECLFCKVDLRWTIVDNRKQHKNQENPGPQWRDKGVKTETIKSLTSAVMARRKNYNSHRWPCNVVICSKQSQYLSHFYPTAI